MLAPHFIQLLTSSRPAAIARIKPLVNTPFVFFFAVNTLRGHKWFFQYVVINLWCWASTIMPEASILFLFFPDIRPAGPGAFFLPPEITLYP